MTGPSVRRPFLTAEWRDLLLFNYEVDPRLLHTLVPRGTELDAWDGRTLISVVGFRFLDTRVLGWAVPFHQAFEEVNLRFYVRRRGPDGAYRRAVVFIREFVPKRAVAWIARLVYNEPYRHAAMDHHIVRDPGATHAERLEYSWHTRGHGCALSARVAAVPAPLTRPSEAEFVTEHYWGYTRQRDGSTLEYEVAHPSWCVAAVAHERLALPGRAVYGPAFADVLAGPPRSAFYAEGSAVTVFRGTRLP